MPSGSLEKVNLSLGKVMTQPPWIMGGVLLHLFPLDDLTVTAGRWPQWSLEYRAQGPWMGFYFLTNLLRQGHSTMTRFPVLAGRSHQGVPLLPPSWPPGVLCVTPALALEPSCQASHLLVPSSHTPLPWSSTHTMESWPCLFVGPVLAAYHVPVAFTSWLCGCLPQRWCQQRERASS